MQFQALAIDWEHLWAASSQARSTAFSAPHRYRHSPPTYRCVVRYFNVEPAIAIAVLEAVPSVERVGLVERLRSLVELFPILDVHGRETRLARHTDPEVR